MSLLGRPVPFRLVRGVLDNQGIHQRDAVANGSRSVTHRHIHSERPLQKLLCGLPDWAAFTLCLAQRGTRNVFSGIKGWRTASR